MIEHTAENDAAYSHRINVNVGGKGTHPVVTLWCMDCLVTVREFDQVNPWDEVSVEVAEHCSQPSRREKLGPPRRVQ
jgi:hypothetical protein